MTTWEGFLEQAPELGRRVEERLRAHRHLTMATVRADGAPRISGTEVTVTDELYLGGMPGNRRFFDLRRDPRVAIHSGSDDPAVWTADAKVSGLAREVTDERVLAAFRAATSDGPPGRFELFRLDLREATVVRLSDDRDHLVVETWRDGRGVSAVERG